MLQKKNIHINFSQGLDTKTDPWQVPVGKFLSLENIIFTKGGLLQKRNGYVALPSLIEPASYVTTFNGDLTAIGSNLQALSAGYNQWVDRGNIQPCSLSVLTLIRNNLNQSQVDASISPMGLVCTVYSEFNNGTTEYKYAIADAVTGQNVVEPTLLVQADPTFGSPRVFNLGAYFIIVYTRLITAAHHLSYLAISTVNPTIISAVTDISSAYGPATTVAFDGIVFDNFLYVAFNGASSSGLKIRALDSHLNLSVTVTIDGAHSSTLVSACADSDNSVIWISYYDSGTSNGYTLALNSRLSFILAPTQIITGIVVDNLTSSAQLGVNTIIYEVANNYSYDSSIPTHYLNKVTCSQSGSVGSTTTFIRSVGLASKSFIIDRVIYVLSVYSSPYQPTYFLIDSSGNEIAKLAYSNAGGYLTTGLPSVVVNGEQAQIPYLFKDLVQSVNKNTNVPAGSQVNGIYSQTGINLSTFTLGANVISAEIGSNLNLTGGFLWSYDGYTPVEQNFFVYPDSIEATTSTTGGHLADQIYFYQVTYEWTDNQGNAFKSAPSIPIKVTASGGGNSSNTIHIPTLRLTYKIANPVKIVIYRWSTAQQIYYQVTSITSPLLNDTSVDQVQFVDTLSDATILGNNIIYTTGGVIENLGPPSFSSVFLFDDRLWGIDSEDPNLLWYSKQVIEATPVEMSDLFTMYIAPSLGAQGPSGALSCGFPMDDKAVLFKKSSLAYFNGTGPDNTGANSQYSPPTLITSTLGCSNQKSIVFMPTGLMFEFASEAGNQIWLLGRDLSTNYIGAPVESFTTNATVESAVNIPGTNQVRFTMSSGVTLMYDYYYQQWGTFVKVPATSSTLYQGLHTYINSFGQVFQESPGSFLDGSNPVLIAFTTSWLNLAGVQGYIRAYWFYLLGKYISPHKLQCLVAYNYNPAPTQNTLITPINFAPTYGGPESNGQNTVYGQDTPYGGPSNVENWRVFLDKERCSAFQITVEEVYDSSFGVPAGEGLTLSGINVVYAGKSGWRPIPASQSAGGQQ